MGAAGILDGMADVRLCSTVDALVHNLVKLQEVELERAKLAKTARALPAELADAEAALSKAQADASAASDSLSREDTLRTRLEREIAGHRQKMQRLQKQLDTVTTPAQAAAMDHEIAFARDEVERLENEELASLERTEAGEALLARAREQVETQAGALDKTRARVGLRQKETSCEQTALQMQRENLRKQIDPDLLSRFDRIANHRGTAMARADNQQCTACSMGIRPQMWNQVREGVLLTCDSCGRMLYWDSAIAPAPADESASPRNSAPPAIPKVRRVL